MLTPNKSLLAPSLLAADNLNLGTEAEAAIQAGADLLHLDIMDQHFVPNLSFGPALCQALHKRFPKIPIDVHLMVMPVDAMILAFAKAGAAWISFHPEASMHVDRSLRLIKDAGCQAGLVLNPMTPLHILEHTLDLVDFILVMSVNPGFGGQTLIPYVPKKIQTLRHMLDTQGHSDVRIAVDGGVDLHNASLLSEAGADTFIMGSAFFGSHDYQQTVKQFHKAVAHG